MLLRKFKKIKQYGVIDTSFFTYFTPAMLIAMAAVIVIIILGFDTIASFYKSGKALNTLIIGVAVYAVFKCFYINYTLQRAAKYLKRVGEIIERGDVDDETVQKLKNRLERDGKLFNTNQMAECIENIKIFGHLNLTDKAAILIKSKLGYRVRTNRSSISFLSGLLVMLGLLGTFMGLLKTVDAVGIALGNVGNLDISGPNGQEVMGQFISSLAAPLQGMGLAFSSSLFGLSGSLLSGFLNNLCAGVQNNFMEDVSRWVDDRIPRFDLNKIGDKKEYIAPNQDDLRTWLMGFVYLANQNNRKMGKLFLAMSELSSKSQQVINETRQTNSYHAQFLERLGAVNDGLGQLRQQGEVWSKAIAERIGGLEAIGRQISAQSAGASEAVAHARSDVSRMSTALDGIGRAIGERGTQSQEILMRSGAEISKMNNLLESMLKQAGEVQQKLATQMSDVQRLLGQQQSQSDSGLKVLQGLTAQQNENLASILAAHNKQTGDIGRLLEGLNTSVQQTGQVQQTLKTSIDELRGNLTAANDQDKMSSVVLQLNTLLEEMKEGVEQDVFKILGNTDKG